ALSNLAPVREGLQWIKALADVTVHLAVHHHLEGANDVVQGDIEFREPIVSPVIIRARSVAVDRLLETDHELAIVLPVADLARTQRPELSRLHIIFEGFLLVGRQYEITGHIVR